MRTRICFWLLVLVPLAVYAPAILQDYAMRDDYSYLRSAREEPGKIVRQVAAQGRPLYGALLETSYEHTGKVSNLIWLRLTSVLLLVCLALAVWQQLDAAGWPQLDAAALGLGLILLPCAQVTAAWAVGWPWALSLLLSVAGYIAIELELEKGGLKRFVGCLGGCFIYILSALIYPSNALFAVVLIAATLLTKERRKREDLLRWSGLHLGLLLGSLAAYYGLLRLLFQLGLFAESARMQMEVNPFTKLVWFIWQPLSNALALLPLRDDFQSGFVYFWLAVCAVVAFLAWVVRGDKVSSDPKAKLSWLICLAVLPWIAHLVSLIASERSTGYRTLAALSGLVLTLVIVGLRRLPVNEQVEPWAHYGGLVVLLLVAAMLARQNTMSLIAEPQAREWSLVHESLQQVRLRDVNRFWMVAASVEDRSTQRVHGDEFGTVSSDSDWAPRDMFAAALHERFPFGLPPEFRISFGQSRKDPQPGTYDTLIDLRKLKRWRD